MNNDELNIDELMITILRSPHMHSRTHHYLDLDHTHTLSDAVVVNTVSFAPDGEHLISATNSGFVSVFRSDSGDLVHSFCACSKENTLNSAVYSPSGWHILTASSDGIVKLWSTAQAIEECVAEINCRCHVKQAIFVGDSQFSSSLCAARIAVLTVDGFITVLDWSSEGGSPPLANSKVVLRGGFGQMRAITASSDGNFLAAGNTRGDIMLWKQDSVWKGHDDAVLCLDTTSTIEHTGGDSSVWTRIMVSGGMDCFICIWGVNWKASKDECKMELLDKSQGHKFAVTSVSIEGRFVVSVSMDGTLCLWSIDTRNPGLGNGNRNKVLMPISKFDVSDKFAIGCDMRLNAFSFAACGNGGARLWQNPCVVDTLSSLSLYAVERSYSALNIDIDDDELEQLPIPIHAIKLLQSRKRNLKL